MRRFFPRIQIPHVFALLTLVVLVWLRAGFPFARLVLAARGVLAPGTAEADRFAREAFVELVAHEGAADLELGHITEAVGYRLLDRAR